MIARKGGAILKGVTAADRRLTTLRSVFGITSS
jgi:hypothetical protein